MGNTYEQRQIVQNMKKIIFSCHNRTRLYNILSRIPIKVQRYKSHNSLVTV